MKDINFFSIYSSKNSVGYKRSRLIKIGIGALAVIILLYGGLTVWLFSMESGTQKINDYLMSPEVQKSVQAYNKEMGKLTATQEYSNAADSLIGSMDFINSLDTKTLGVIAGSLPTSAKMDDISYNGGSFSMSFTVPSLWTASQLAVRLEETQLFDKVTLSNVSKGEDAAGYTCSIDAIMKVGDEV